MHPTKPSRKPWSMKWVVLAIALFVLGYTTVMVLYRKPNKAFEPYQDSANRVTVTRLLNSGYQRIPLPTIRPADPTREAVLQGVPAAAVSNGPGGLPTDIAQALAIPPLLADSIGSCTVPARSSQLLPYKGLVAMNLADNDRVLTEVLLFRKGQSLVFLPVFELTSKGLQARWRETTAVFTIPSGTLPAGRYEAALFAQKNSRTWSFSVGEGDAQTPGN